MTVVRADCGAGELAKVAAVAVPGGGRWRRSGAGGDAKAPPVRVGQPSRALAEPSTERQRAKQRTERGVSVAPGRAVRELSGRKPPSQSVGQAEPRPAHGPAVRVAPQRAPIAPSAIR